MAPEPSDVDSTPTQQPSTPSRETHLAVNEIMGEKLDFRGRAHLFDWTVIAFRFQCFIVFHFSSILDIYVLIIHTLALFVKETPFRHTALKTAVLTRWDAEVTLFPLKDEKIDTMIFYS